MKERLTELRHALNDAAQAVWDIQGVTDLLLNSGEMGESAIHPAVRAVVNLVNERATAVAKKIEEVL
ncbi:hypothetical protein D7Y24_19325 [Stenotrophomonas maltophilia]|uniref:hypothetical protein n=1 Tax=Stenotrophomonas maltophilia TaxID=40324 RepID=UPI0015DE5562|nr:hypothetical protein [Stenotrophomonas maltophilia]ELN2584901.1 hypothetical protein [Stenotrophomonas maltophilia]ELN2592916.1 hypothetical protein [Stenotrophomonas maltophilia]MBA0300556.1 hypothetical protein [Stenotrophomonas maltophilia]MBH1400411.1 hypothetical protein [Stenotrophomonas maltophilia]MBH1703061.1 hypothetical protein [Stenotrophomonas maltophilia]